MLSALEPLPWGQPLSDALAAAPGGAPVAVLMRHSAREALVDMASADGVPLTPAGEEAARQFGARLPPGRRVRLMHSPTGRCAVTAQRVAEGFQASGGDARIDGVLPALGGLYVRDVEGMLRLVRQLGSGYARAWFDGRLPPEVMAPRDEAARLIVDAAAALLAAAPDGALLLLVSHDWNVMLVRESVLGLTHEAVGWLEYLDGLLLTRDGTGVQVDWRGHRGGLPARPPAA